MLEEDIEEFSAGFTDFPALGASNKRATPQKDDIFTPILSTKINSKMDVNDAYRDIVSMKMIYMLLINFIITKEQAIYYAKIINPNSKPATSSIHDITSSLKQWSDCAIQSGIM